MEIALLQGIRAAAEAGDVETLSALTRELEAHRQRRADVPTLAEERARRGKG